MSLNDTREVKMPTTGRTSRLTGGNAPISLLKINNMPSKNSLLKPIPNSNTPTIVQDKKEFVQILHPTHIPSKSQPSINNSNSKKFSEFLAPAQSLLKSSHFPKIPIQFQSAAAKQQKSQKSYELDTKKFNSIMTTTPSGINSTTVNHANRSLVYPEAVSTKEIAPTANIIGIYTNRFHPNLFNNRQDSIYSPRIAIAQNSSDKISEIKVSSTEPSLIPSVKLNSDESVNGTSFNLYHTNKTQLIETFNGFNSNQTIHNNHRKHHRQISATNYSLQEKVNTNMDEMTVKNHILKRSRAKSTYIHTSDASFTGSRLPPKIIRTISNEADIVNLKDSPEKSAKSETKMVKTVNQQEYLYNKLKDDDTKVLYDPYGQKHETKSISIAGGSNNVRISNGQLSDINGPIRLVDKPTKQISTPNVIARNHIIASWPKEDKARKLKESIETMATELNKLENQDERQFKRTYSRSKSMSVKSPMHFKIDSLKSKPKLKKVTQLKPTLKQSIDHDKDWQSLTDSLSSNVAAKPMITTGGVSSEQMIHGHNSRTQSPPEILLTWNTSKTLGQLPSSQIIFQRNEFGTIEVDKLAMTKLKAMKRHKNDYKNFPQLEPSMACGHSDSAACFDAIIQRLNSTNSNTTCQVYQKKPNQYYSTEFKQVIGALVQNKNNNCQAITTDDVKEALRDSSMYDRTKNSSHFSWLRYIDYYNKKYISEKSIKLTPPELFVNAIPRTPNTFEIGQKLEAIDPQNSELFCVCTIVDKCGYRIKLRFDGSSSIYDFWVNADSKNIFPAGWCSKTGRKLEVTRHLINNRSMTFEWEEYLRRTNTQAAHRACFPNVNTAKTQMNPFKIGMKLEAEVFGRICVATVGDVIDSQILVRFDELDSSNNYWTDIRSPLIHPVNFHQDGSYSIMCPPSWKSTPFSWEAYLRMNRAEPVPRDAFYTREPKPFENGMALEVIDKKNPTLIRPAIITMIQDYQIKVLFIGWAEKYAYWLDDDSCDIFPPGYCKRTGHPIECPLDAYIYEIPKNSCGILGCRGIGNAKRLDATTHSILEECPYEWNNWSTVESDMRPNRIERKHKTVNNSFNIGAGPSRKISVNPAFEKVQVSLQPTLNPAELAAMSSKDVEIFRRLQVSAKFLLENHKVLSELRDQWIDRIKPLRMVQMIASAKNPLNWSKEEVAKFVSQLPNCSTLGAVFIENDIDGLAFLALRTRDMIDVMGLSTGAAIKVFNRIMLLREECNTHYIRYQ